MHSTSVGDLSTFRKRYLRMVFGLTAPSILDLEQKNKIRSGQISGYEFRAHTDTHLATRHARTSSQAVKNEQTRGESSENKKNPNKERQTGKLFLAVWLWVKARIRSSASLECFVVLNEREREASRYTDEHAGRQKTLVSDAASSPECEPPCLPFIICQGYVENITLVTAFGQGKKNAQLETNTKFLFLLDGKLLSLHLCVEKTRLQDGAERKIKKVRNRAFFIDR